MKRWIAINLLLLATAALLGSQLRKSISQFKAENDLAKIQPAADLKQKLLQEKAPPPQPAARIYIPAEFSIIAEKNLFSLTRSKEEKVENTAPPEPPPLAQKPILVGTTITDTERKASIIDPTAQSDMRNRKGSIQRIGDVYQGYTITEIAPDRIVLESGTRREVIPLREGSKHGQGGKTAILSTRIVSFGGGGVTGGTPVTVATGNVSAAATSTPGRAAVAPIGTPSATAAAQATVVSPARATPAQPSGQQAPQGDPRMRVVRTPFGDIVRREPVE